MRKSPRPLALWAAVSVAQTVVPAAIVAAGLVSASRAQSRAEPIELNLRAQPLAAAVAELAATAGVEIRWAAGAKRDQTARVVSGRMTASEALTALLANSGLQFQMLGERQFEIRPAVPTVAQEQGRVTAVVRVEADLDAEVSANGSRDRSATEGSASLGTRSAGLASRGSKTLLDTEKSVSVLTRQQIEDQRLATVSQVMEQLPGVTVATGINPGGGANNLTPSFYARGFQITEFSVDGGRPVSIGTNDGVYRSHYNPLFDMSVYDRVELLRGVNGVYGSAGAGPGGVVSLVRKSPLAENFWGVEAEAHSFGGLRMSVDRSQLLSDDGSLALRFVLTGDKGRFFYKPAEYERRVVYANLESRLSKDSTLTVGFEYGWLSGTAWSDGWPRWQASAAPMSELRRTCLCSDDSRSRTEQVDLFANWEQRLTDDWRLRVNLRTLRQHGSMRAIGVYAPLDGVPADGTTGVMVRGNRSASGLRSFGADIKVGGSFNAFGRHHQLAFGVEAGRGRSNSPDGGAGDYAMFFDRPADLLQWDPAAWREDTASEVLLSNGQVLSNRFRTEGAFIDAAFSLTDRLTLGLGVRYNAYRSENITRLVYADEVFLAESREKESRLAPPSASLRYAVTPQSNLYASYASLYTPQTRTKSADGSSLWPILGNTIELGFKRSDFGGTLNSSLAVYRTARRHLPVRDDSVPPYSLPDGTDCCYLRDSDQREVSRGVELEVAGAITPRWQLAASLTHNKTRSIDPASSGPPAPDRAPFQAFQPRQRLKLWSTYELPRMTPAMPSLVGLGINAQTATQASGAACNEEGECRSMVVREPGRAVLAAMGRWQLASNLQVQFNIDNLTDRVYLQTVGSTQGSNWFGEPRKFTLSLKWKPN